MVPNLKKSLKNSGFFVGNAHNFLRKRNKSIYNKIKVCVKIKQSNGHIDILLKRM